MLIRLCVWTVILFRFKFCLKLNSFEVINSGSAKCLLLYFILTFAMLSQDILRVGGGNNPVLKTV